MKGVDASSIQAVMLDKDKMEERNFANYYKGTLEEIIHKAQESGKSDIAEVKAVKSSSPIIGKAKTIPIAVTIIAIKRAHFTASLILFTILYKSRCHRCY